MIEENKIITDEKVFLQYIGDRVEIINKELSKHYYGKKVKFVEAVFQLIEGYMSANIAYDFGNEKEYLFIELVFVPNGSYKTIDRFYEDDKKEVLDSVRGDL